MKMLRFTSAGGSAHLLLVSVFYFLLSPSAFPQGSLTPPPGTPAPTMKTLDQVDTHIDVKGEKRIDLQNAPAAAVTTTDASYHFIINQPGSYYLSANLGVTKNSGIQINAEGVTLDLNGFEISRTAGALGNGIFVNGTLTGNCTIQNGSIQGFGGGISASSRGGRISFINVSNCSAGSGISTGDGWVVDHCSVHDNTATGIFVGKGCTVSQCTATNNTNGGIGTGDGSTIVDCSAYGNSFAPGIFTGIGSTVTHCTAKANTSASTVSSGIFTGAGCLVVSCTADGNLNTNGTPTTQSGAGIIVGARCTVQGCAVSGNKGDGINAPNDCIISANTAALNGNGGDGAGVHVTGSDNRIEANNVTSNDRGIDVSAAGNLIIKNSARNNGASSAGNYAIVADNRYGPIIDDTATGSIAASGKGPFTSTLTSTDPWANFSY